MTDQEMRTGDRPKTRETPPVPTVKFVGRRTIEVPGKNTRDDSMSSVVRTMELRCRSGARFTKTWEGVLLSQLLDDAAAPADTTHLVVEADDGHTACISVGDVLEGVLAFERIDSEQGTRTQGMPRVVAPGLDGARAVKNVTRIEPVELSPEEDPSDAEQFEFESIPSSSKTVDDEE